MGKSLFPDPLSGKAYPACSESGRNKGVSADEPDHGPGGVCSVTEGDSNAIIAGDNRTVGTGIAEEN